MEILQYEFIRNAVTAAFLLSIACGIIGTYVVTRRIVFISGGIAHAAFGGIGLANYFNFNIFGGALVFSILSAVGLEFVKNSLNERKDTIIGIIWSIGMAIGIIFVYLTPGYTSNLFSFLFGNILMVTKSDIIIMIIFDIILLLIITFFYHSIKAAAFDKEFAYVIGLPVRVIELIMLVLIAAAIILLIKAVGIILIIAMLTIPVGIANKYTNNFKLLMLLSVIFAVIFNLSGLFISYFLNLPSGATIILFAGIIYLAVHIPIPDFKNKNHVNL